MSRWSSGCTAELEVLALNLRLSKVADWTLDLCSASPSVMWGIDITDEMWVFVLTLTLQGMSP